MIHPAWCDPVCCMVGRSSTECHVGEMWSSADGTTVVALMQVPGEELVLGVFDDAVQIVIGVDRAEEIADAIRRVSRKGLALL